MIHGFAFRLVLAVTLGLGLTIAPDAAEARYDDPTPPAAPDAAIAGEWIAFCSIRIPSDLSLEGQAALRETLGFVLGKSARWVYPAGAPEIDRVRSTISKATAGEPATLWLLPPPDNEPGPLTVVSNDDLTKAPRVAGAASAEWLAHRTKSAAAHPEYAPAIELAVNLNNARRHFPAAFDLAASAQRAGCFARVLEALRLSNARVAGLHIRIIPPHQVKTRDPSLPRLAGASDVAYKGPAVAVIDATWSARSEPPGKVYLAPLSTDHWPLTQVGEPAGDDGLAAVVRLSWRGGLEAAIGIHGGMLSTSDAARFDRQSMGWLEAHKSAVTRLTSTLDPWVRVGIQAEAPHEVRATARLRDDASATATAATFDSFVGTLPGGIEPAGRTPPWSWTAVPAADAGWWLGRVAWELTERKAPERSTIDVSLSTRAD